MTVHTLSALDDNLIYLVTHGPDAVVIDPGMAGPVRHAIEQHAVRLEAILVTHTHSDHTGGCAELKDACGCRVIGPTGTPGVDQALDGDAHLSLGGLRIWVLTTPGHTSSDLTYVMPDDAAAFTGDTLIAGACGRVFGSDTAALWHSLLRIRALPDATRIHGGHDYLLENLAFAAGLEPRNAALQARLAAEKRCFRARATLTAPALADEKRVNPFLRCDDPALAEAIDMNGAAAETIFAHLRKQKDQFIF